MEYCQLTNVTFFEGEKVGSLNAVVYEFGSEIKENLSDYYSVSP